MDVFDCAIKMEEDARKCYRKLAANSDVPEMRNLFTILAASEQEHRAALLGLKKRVDRDKSAFRALQGATCAFKPLSTRRDSISQRRDPDGYKHVVKEEEQAVKLYEDLADRTKDKQTREILLMVAAEERKHLNIVENIYSFVESPRTFLAWGEFSNLKEF